MSKRASREDALLQALAFYADPETYVAVRFYFDPPCGEFREDFERTALGMKPGARARKALAAWMTPPRAKRAGAKRRP